MIDRFVEIIKERFPEQPIKTICDIGALHGMQAISLANAFPDARVFAFECNPTSIIQTVFNTGFTPNIQVIPLGVWDENQIRTFFMIDAYSGGASSFLPLNFNEPVTQDGNHNPVPITVGCITLQDFCRFTQIPHMDVIWMDVQGAELNVLTGLGDLIHKVKAIHTEVCFREYYQGQPLYPDIDKFLTERGFVCVHKDTYTEESLDTNVIYVNQNLSHQNNK